MTFLHRSFELEDSDSLGAKWRLGDMYQLLGRGVDALIEEVNKELKA